MAEMNVRRRCNLAYFLFCSYRLVAPCMNRHTSNNGRGHRLGDGHKRWPISMWSDDRAVGHS